MKSNSLAALLLGMLLVVALFTAWFAVSFNLSYLELRRLQSRAAAYANNRVVVQALANDVVEYGKRNPAIDPILKSAGLKATNEAAVVPNNVKSSTR